MEGNYLLLILISSLVLLIAVIKFIQKYFERKEVDSILELMKKKTKEDKEVEQKFKECIKIIEQNKK